MPRLVLNAGTPEARGFELKPGSNYVGRAFSNDLKIEDPSVSSNHARIVVEGEVVTLKDLGSTNGTFINRSQVVEGFLQPGQIITLGAVELLFESNGATATVAPPSMPASAAAAPARPASGLRYAGSVAVRASASPVPPPMTSAPPIPPPVPSARVATAGGTEFVEAPGGKTSCKFHPKAPARWLCSKCGQIYCDLCVTARPMAGGATGHFCRPCGGECTPVAYRPKVNVLVAGSFFTLLPTAFAYPFKKDRKYILIGAIVCYIIMITVRSCIPRIPPLTWYLKAIPTVIFFGYWYSFLQNIITTTAYGDDNEPSLPEASYSDLIGPVRQMFATTALCFLPTVALLIWGFFSGNLYDPDSPIRTLLFVLVPLSCLYYPMAVLAMAISDSVSGVNPLVVIPAIIKTPLHYLVACLLLGVVVGCYWVGRFFLPLFLPVPILTMAIASCVWLYLMMVMSRVLGLLYYYNREKLGWIRHHH